MAAVILGAGVALAAGFGGWKWLNKYKEPAMIRFWDFPDESNLLRASSIVLFNRSDDDLRYAASDRAHPRIGSDFKLRPTYVPLQPVTPQTRLLIIESVNEQKIICSMYNADLSTLSTSNAFSALSYKWGGPIKLIVLNHQLVEVTDSVHSALTELYRRGRRRVWVDALCIDQANDAEKVRQMAHMHSIYSMAREVVVWLGPADVYSNVVIGAIQEVEEYRAEKDSFGPFLFDLAACWAAKKAEADPEVGKLYKKQKDGEGRPRLAQARAMFTSQKVDPRLEAFTRSLQASAKGFLFALKQVSERPYWRRAWIIQELTAARQLEVWCGTSSLDYASFVSILKDLESVTAEGSYVGLGFCQTHILGLDHLKSRWKPDEAIHLLEALRDSYHTRCSDKFDEIYALLGMCFNSKRFVPITDYAISMEELLLRMTENHIMSSGSLDVICMQMRGRSAFHLPSWAPDWRLIGREKFNHRMISYLIGEDQRPKPHKNDRRWSASGSSTWSPYNMGSDRRLLAVRRRLIGRITWLENAPASSNGFRPTSTRTDSAASADDQIKDDIYAIVFDTMMVYKQRDAVDDSRDEWKHVFQKRALQRIAKHSPRAHQRLTRTLEHACIRGKTLHAWSMGVPDDLLLDPDDLSKAGGPTSVVSLVLLSLTYGPYVLRGIDRLLRHDYKQHILPSSIRSRTLEDALCKVLEDEMPLMQVEEEPQQHHHRQKKAVAEPHEKQHGSGGKKWYLGWAHPHARLGDEVCLLEGCTLPVILRRVVVPPERPPDQHHVRRSKDRLVYTVVGDAHVTGIMSGQMWPTTQKRRDNLLQDIWLA